MAPGDSGQIRPSTLHNYSLAMQRYVIPRIGGQQLGRGHAGDVECSVRRLARDWSLGGLDGLSPKTVKEVHTILHKALHDAVRWGRLGRNPADLADPPAARSPEMQVWSAEQLRKFVKSVEGDRLYAMWLMYATTGMRRGEVLGLRWRDVDHQNGRIAVVQSPLIVAAKIVFSEPKTNKGLRSVALDPTRAAALQFSLGGPGAGEAPRR